MGVMASKFDELSVWQNARVLAKEVYRLSMSWKDFGLKDQIRRAVVSISSNIAEGYDRGSSVDFVRFLYIARGSGSEVRSQLYLAYDLGYLDEKDFGRLHDQVDVVVRQLTSFIGKLKRK